MTNTTNEMKRTYVDHLAKLFSEMDEDLHSQFNCRARTVIEDDSVVYHIEVKRQLSGVRVR